MRRGRLLYRKGGSAQLHDRVITATPSGTGRVAQYFLFPDGTVKDQTSTTLETWLLSGSASDFQVRATLLSGTISSGTTGTWLGLGGVQTWALGSGGPAPPVQGVLKIEIRDAATLAILATATVELDA